MFHEEDDAVRLVHDAGQHRKIEWSRNFDVAQQLKPLTNQKTASSIIQLNSTLLISR